MREIGVLTIILIDLVLYQYPYVCTFLVIFKEEKRLI